MPMWMSLIGSKSGTPMAHLPSAPRVPTSASVIGSTHTGSTSLPTRSGTAAAKMFCLSAIEEELSIMKSRSIFVMGLRPPSTHSGPESGLAASMRMIPCPPSGRAPPPPPAPPDAAPSGEPSAISPPSGAPASPAPPVAGGIGRSDFVPQPAKAKVGTASSATIVRRNEPSITGAFSSMAKDSRDLAGRAMVRRGPLSVWCARSVGRCACHPIQRAVPF